MVNIDYLQFRKNKVRQPIQYAWCAATTRNFLGINTNKISRTEIVNLDIGSLCDDIMSAMSDSQEGMRCTLYLSSMLTSGAIKLFQDQTTFFLEDCEKLMLNLIGGQNPTTQKKKKKTKEQYIPEVPFEKYVSLTPLSTPKFDPMKTFGKKNVEDRNLLSEIDFIDIPEPDKSFGFNPNERELTDRDIAEFYREMIGEEPQPLLTENVSQNDETFKSNDEPMHQEPLNSIVNQLPSNHVPQLKPEIMKTPKRPTRSLKQKPSILSESAKIAYSPPKKRSRIATYRSYDDNNDDIMMAAEPTREASLPSEVPLDADCIESPIFDFRKKIISRDISLRDLHHIKSKAKEVAVIFDEPMLDASYVQHESPPHIDLVKDANVDLPEVSFHESSPATIEQKDNAPTHSPNVPFHVSPMVAAQPNTSDSARIFPKSSKISVTDLTLGSLHSFEENYRKKYIKRGKKIFADRIRQIEIEARSPEFMTLTRDEMLFTYALTKQLVDSLFNYPSTLKREIFLPDYRHWSDKLLRSYNKAICTALTLAVTPKKTASAQKRKKKRDGNRESSHKNRDTSIENMKLVQEEGQSLSSKNIEMNKHSVIEIPETFVTTLNVAPVDIQTENPNNQIMSDIIHDAVHEFEPPPILYPVVEKPLLQEVTDQVENMMSPKKKFKNKDDRQLQNMEIHSKMNLTINKLFEIIQSFWNKCTKRDIEQLGFVSVEFEKVIRPGYYNVVEVGRYLYYCFLLENKKKLYLQQKIPYDTIYLIKW